MVNLHMHWILAAGIVIGGCTSINVDHLRRDFTEMTSEGASIEHPIAGLTVEQLHGLTTDHRVMVSYRDSVTSERRVVVGLYKYVEFVPTDSVSLGLRAHRLLSRSTTHPTIDLYRGMDSVQIVGSPAVRSVMIMQNDAVRSRIPLWDIDAAVVVDKSDAYRESDPAKTWMLVLGILVGVPVFLFILAMLIYGPPDMSLGPM